MTMKDPGHVRAGLSLLLLLFLSAAARAQDTPASLRIDGYSLAREKVGAVAVVEATLANDAAAPAGPFDAVLQVLDSYALVKESAPVPVAAIPPGKGAKARFEINHCPAFSWLRIVLRPKGSEKVAHCFVARSLDKPPAAEAVDASVIRRQLGAEARLSLVEIRAAPDAAGGGTAVTVKVRNGSPEPVVFPLARLRFLDGAGKEIAARPCLLGMEEIPPKSEDDYRAAVSGLPAFERVQADLAWGESLIELPVGVGTPAAKELAVEGYRFVRFTHGDVWIVGHLVSRLRETASDVVLSLQLMGKGGQVARSLRYAFPGPVGAGERQGFQLWAAAAPAFESYKFSLAFVTAGGDEAAKPGKPPANEDPGLVIAERTGRRAAAPAKVEKEEKKEASAVAQAEVAGWSWIDGAQVRININKTVYSGDTGFLKLRFANAEGLPAQPEGTVILRVYDRGTPQGTIRRALSAAAWKRDASKLTGATTADAVAADGATAWVGVLRVPDKGTADFTLDVTIDIPKTGTWEWKGLAAPFSAAAGPPNKPKK
jgi:hypothetical protein